MKMKIMITLLIIICVSLFVPSEVLAKNIRSFYNTNIDYRFFVDEDNVGNLKFKLYDKTGSLSYDSEYDSTTKSYRFFVDENDYRVGDKNLDGDVYYNSLCPYDWDAFESGIRNYIPYSSELQNLNTFNDVKNFLETNKLNNKWKKQPTFNFSSPISEYGKDYDNGLGNIYEFNIYSYIPMILEVFDHNDNSILKKIVFASINIRCSSFYNMDYPYYDDNSYDDYYIGISLVNNTSHWNNDKQYIFGNSFLENVNFMRKTILDYSDELWEELNNGPIASSEISSNNQASANYKYVNQSIGTGEQNVPEETLDDYANSLPVLSFRKTDSTNNTSSNNEDNNHNDDNKIVDIVTNPKTWNSGVIVLIISMILIISTCYLLIRRKGGTSL